MILHFQQDELVRDILYLLNMRDIVEQRMTYKMKQKDRVRIDIY